MLVGLLGGEPLGCPKMHLGTIPFDNPRPQDVFSKSLNGPTFGL
jgi:hypothetical protein